MTAIRNSLYSIQEVVEESDATLSRPLVRAERNITRCENIIGELLDYTRIRELDLEPTSIDGWLEEVLDAQRTPDGVRFERKLGADNVNVPLDSDRLRRVVINLFDNACQAMVDQMQNDGDRSDHRLTITSSVVGDTVRVSFADTGPGITQENLARIFEPLFTTKSGGVGLGLPTVQQIMKQHGGGVRFESEGEKGATAVIWLPLSGVVAPAA